MSRRRFEELVDREKAELGEAMFKLTAGDAIGHATIKGKRIGLERALELYRSAVRDDNHDQGGL